PETPSVHGSKKSAIRRGNQPGMSSLHDISLLGPIVSFPDARCKRNPRAAARGRLEFAKGTARERANAKDSGLFNSAGSPVQQPLKRVLHISGSHMILRRNYVPRRQAFTGEQPPRSQEMASGPTILEEW